MRTAATSWGQRARSIARVLVDALREAGALRGLARASRAATLASRDDALRAVRAAGVKRIFCKSPLPRRGRIAQDALADDDRPLTSERPAARIVGCNPGWKV